MGLGDAGFCCALAAFSGCLPNLQGLTLLGPTMYSPVSNLPRWLAACKRLRSLELADVLAKTLRLQRVVDRSSFSRFMGNDGDPAFSVETCEAPDQQQQDYMVQRATVVLAALQQLTQLTKLK